MNILLASLLSPITLSFVAGIFAALIGFAIKVPKRALQLFTNLLLVAIGIDGGRGLAASDLSGLGAGLAVTFSLILLLPALSYVIARYLTCFSVPDSAALATLYGSVSSAVLMAAYAESGDMNLEVDGLVMGMAALMELGILVALSIGTLALSRETGAVSSKGSRIGDIVRGGFPLLLFGLLIGWLVGDRHFGRIENIVDLILTGTLMLFMVEMGMVTAGELRNLRATAARAVSFALLMPAVGGFLGTLLATLAGLSSGSAFVMGAVAASASFINAPSVVRVSFPTANPSIYLTCALGVTFPVLLLVGLPLLAQLALLWGRLFEPSGG
ncbi:sodium-dependent bicarbonate transport family permease [Peristeroidobacter agariperforans]|uniref:sodium-dependent bicarbonate transport family permease n=1 Tax=Peristeroidobacter agariperforans TaxID=268404 RepID=UPI0013003E05|nr:sodium-dependent bicarbonate transport family permease [Peristeroidobacter agariperforans]